MAVRATAIVLKAYQAGTLPPAVVAMNSLSGNSKLPDLAKLKEVLNMQHLVRCIEYIYFNAQYPKYYENNLFYKMEGEKYPAVRRRFPDWSKIGQRRNREYETCFGLFASWIIEDGRMREQNEPQDPNDTEPDWAENRADIGAVRELMLLLVAYDHFNDSFQNYYGVSSPYLQKQGNRTVSIVRFGIFKVEEITMPAAAEDLTDTPLFAQYHPALEGTAGKDIKDQIDNFGVMWELKQKMRTHIPYHREHLGPPATLELWHFALRHYLNLTFKPGTFWMPRDCDCIWWREVGRGEIFLNPNWNVVQKYNPRVISWDYQNN